MGRHSAYSPPYSSANITISEGIQWSQSTRQFCQHHNLGGHTAPTVHPPVLPTSQSGKAHSAYSPPSSSANITISEGTQCLQYTLQFCQHNFGRHTAPTVHPPVLPTSQSQKVHSAYNTPSSSVNITISEGKQRLQSTLHFCQHHHATLIFRRI